MKPRINAVYLTVLDMKRAVRFYEEVFDMGVTDFQERMSSFEMGDFTLLLYDPEVDGIEPVFGDNAVINIEVDDVEEMLSLLQRKGRKVVVPITRIEPDAFFQILDTEGNTVEFYQVLSS